MAKGAKVKTKGRSKLAENEFKPDVEPEAGGPVEYDVKNDQEVDGWNATAGGNFGEWDVPDTRPVAVGSPLARPAPGSASNHELALPPIPPLGNFSHDAAAAASPRFSPLPQRGSGLVPPSMTMQRDPSASGFTPAWSSNFNGSNSRLPPSALGNAPSITAQSPPPQPFQTFSPSMRQLNATNSPRSPPRPSFQASASPALNPSSPFRAPQSFGFGGPSTRPRGSIFDAGANAGPGVQSSPLHYDTTIPPQEEDLPPPVVVLDPQAADAEGHTHPRLSPIASIRSRFSSRSGPRATSPVRTTVGKGRKGSTSSRKRSNAEAPPEAGPAEPVAEPMPPVAQSWGSPAAAQNGQPPVTAMMVNRGPSPDGLWDGGRAEEPGDAGSTAGGNKWGSTVPTVGAPSTSSAWGAPGSRPPFSPPPPPADSPPRHLYQHPPAGRAVKWEDETSGFAGHTQVSPPPSVSARSQPRISSASGSSSSFHRHNHRQTFFPQPHDTAGMSTVISEEEHDEQIVQREHEHDVIPEGGLSSSWGHSNAAWNMGDHSGETGDDWGVRTLASEEPERDWDAQLGGRARSPPLPNVSVTAATRLGGGVGELDPHTSFVDAGFGLKTGGATVKIQSSRGEALEPAKLALYGMHRVAEGRIIWSLPYTHDPRVVWMHDFIERFHYAIATYGFNKYIRTRERGALIANVDYAQASSPNDPAFDWMSFGDSQKTRDRTIQRSIAANNPATTCVVFMFLLSKSGNSIGIWRRRIPVPEKLLTQYRANLRVIEADLRRKEYVVKVDPTISQLPHRTDSAPPLSPFHDEMLKPMPNSAVTRITAPSPVNSARTAESVEMAVVEPKKKKKRSWITRWITWGHDDSAKIRKRQR